MIVCMVCIMAYLQKILDVLAKRETDLIFGNALIIMLNLHFCRNGVDPFVNGPGQGNLLKGIDNCSGVTRSVVQGSKKSF